MEHDIDAKIEEVAHDVASDRAVTLNDLRYLQAYASNPFAVKVFTRAIELRNATTEGSMPKHDVEVDPTEVRDRIPHA